MIYYIIRQGGRSISCLLSALFFLLFAILFQPAVALSFPEGNGSLSLLHRFTGQDSSSSDSTTLNESLFRLDLYQTAPGYGGLFFSSDFSRDAASPGSDINSLSRYQIGLEGYRLGNRLNTIIAGDTSIRFTNLVEGFQGPYYSLYSVRPLYVSPYYPEPGIFSNTNYLDINFRGGAVNSVTNNDSLMLFGGKLATVKGFMSNEFNFVDETVYGVKWAHQWSPDFHAGFGIAQTQGQQRQTGSSQTTVNNTILLLDGSYRVNGYLKFIGEYRENIFRQEGNNINDRSFKVGPVITLPRLKVEANYRYTGPNFLYFRENLQTEQDIKGVFASAEYRMNNHLTFFTSVDWNQNNLYDNRLLPAVNTLSSILGGYFFHPSLPTLSLRFSLSDRNSRPASSTYVDDRIYSAFIETSKQFKLLTPYLRLQGDLEKDNASSANSARTGSVVAGFRAFPTNSFNLFLEGEDQLRTTDQGATTDNCKATGGMVLAMNSQVNLYTNVEYANIKEKPAGTNTETISAFGGATIALPARFFLNGDIRYSSNKVSGMSITNSSTLQITVGLVKRFSWGRPKVAPLPGQSGVALLSEIGYIEGYVFQDLNRNGIKDEGEPGMAGIAVFLEDGSKAITGADGKFSFSDIVTGIHQVSINERGLPASFNLLASPSQRVKVALRETTNVLFPLQLSGAIRGRMLIDKNGNGIADESDTPLPDILVYLDGTQVNTFSDTDGNFAMENLLPGKYTVKIDQTGLAEGMKLVSQDSYQVEVKSGEEVKGVVFLVMVEKKQVIKKIFKGASTPEAPETGAKRQRKSN